MADLKELWRDELQPTAVNVPDPRDRADVIARAYDELGLWSPEQREAAPDLIRASLGELAATGHELQMETYVAVPLTEAFDLTNFVASYDKLPAKAGYYKGETSIYRPLWSQYKTSELGLPAASGARGMVTGNEPNDYDEPGLYFTGQAADKQRKNAAKRVTELTNAGELDASVLDPAGWLALNAIRRYEGKPLLDRQTFTRFVQMEQKTADGGSWLPDAYSRGGQLRLSGSVGRAVSDDGVRFSVGPKA